MAHFAKLDENNVVLEVHCVHNNELLVNGIEVEAVGVVFLINWSGGHPFWKQTSYNGNIRKNYAGVGFTYDPSRDAFIPPKPYNSWTLNEDTCLWQPPVAQPVDDNMYEWDEESLSWRMPT
jgi:hypothetical protein